MNTLKTMRFLKIIGLALLLSLAACQEGSENPEDTGEKDAAPARSKASITDVEAGIRSYIDTKTEEGNGYFHLANDTQEFRLKLVRVHTEYLSVLGPQRYFACVDLADTTGDVYDVDFFLEGEPGDMAVTQTTVHKLNGKPFYTWEQREDKTWHRVEVKKASNQLMGVIEGRDTFEFYYTATLPEMDDSARMWLPLATTDDYQKITVQSIEAPVRQQILEEQEYGNKILFLELAPEHSGQEVRITYEVVRREKGPYPEPKPEPKRYLASTELMPVGGRFSDIADEAMEGEKQSNNLVKARALYDYIIDNMRYAKQGVYGTGDANYACDARSGNCTEFHSFFISLARSEDIPARFAIGAAIPSERDEGGVDGYHCWAEFYAEGKWWPVDISEGNKYTALATYYFGHHPANRIELSRGRDLQLEPGPQSGAVNFLAYPVLEVGGEEMQVETEFSFKR